MLIRDTNSPFRRLSATVFALLALATILTRMYLTRDSFGLSWPGAAWYIFRFFTLWGVAAVGFVLARIALYGTVSQRLYAGALQAIIIVSVVYYALLAADNDYVGLDRIVDLSLHLILPVAFALHWVLFEPKDQMGWADIPYWLIFPAVYCIYALLRGASDGIYPYGFLDLAALGWAQFSINVLGLLIAFSVVGALLVILARKLR